MRHLPIIFADKVGLADSWDTRRSSIPAWP